MGLRSEGLNPVQIAQALNSEFQSGTKAYEVLPLLRSLPRPICVDLNNVLINNSDPHACNPEASRFLGKLRKFGNIIVVTTAESWQAVHAVLQEYRLWVDDIVLMTYPTWGFMYERHNPNSNLLISEYVDFMAELGKTVSPDDFYGAPVCKHIAPIFRKRFKIPMIDDTSFATSDNPGIYGIKVKVFEPNDPYSEKGAKGVSLDEAAKIVERYYKRL